MSNVNLASVKDLKALVASGAVTHVNAIARCETVLARNISPAKRARWTRLREWVLRDYTGVDNA